jgi:predicted DNA-binding WGR domain protein
VIKLTRSDPSKNMNRFYALQLAPSLFGEWVLVAEWGRNHTFRATGITAYLKNGGTLENAAAMANHASTRTTQLYDRRRDEVSLDEAERISI